MSKRPSKSAGTGPVTARRAARRRIVRRSEEAPRTRAPSPLGAPRARASADAHGVSKSAEHSLLVVGIGASAGGLEALEQFFASAPKDGGIAYVVVQHLEPRHPSLLAELLGRCTQMPVGSISDGEALEPNRVFVIPPNAALTVRKGVLHISPPVNEPRAPINIFFKSLAEDRGELAVGILLSGTGTDGAFGLRAIREHGGFTLAQPPETAKHPSMPQHAITAGFVDEVLAVEAMPARVLEHAAGLANGAGGRPVRETEVRESLGKICEVMRRVTGHDFSGYKEGTLLRRIRRRIQLLRIDSAAEYVKRLMRDGEEPSLLLRDLLIGVTQFFREPAAFDALAEEVIPRLLEDNDAERPIRIWVPGCASGEEVYSIAILLQEQRLATGAMRPIQLFATDIDGEALAAARAGKYRADIADHLSPERLERFFTRADGGYQVVKGLRDLCIFSAHNLLRDPPFSSLDLISCRNLLIYLAPGLQSKVIPVLHYALRRGGFLFLGSSEELSSHRELFEAVDKKHRILQRKETLVRPMLEFPLEGPRTARSTATPLVAHPRGFNPKQTVMQAFERMLLEHFAPAAAVVDERGEMLCLSGKRSPVLQVPAGLATNNLLNYAEGTLRDALRTTLAQSAMTRAEVIGPEVVTEVAKAPRRLRVTASPAPGALAQSGLYAVVIEDLGSALISSAKTTAALSRDPMIEQLENELMTTRADLQASNEELESAIEELKSSNQELTSTNEELQSANEELRTSQEELQSVNEELETVNSELRQKVHELGVANSDLQNLYSSTEVATIFLDRELKLAKFTPAATTLFHFIDSDVGRPLSDLAPRFAGTDLLSDVKEVLRALVPVEREIRAGDAWFILRVLPYRTLDDVIAGAVITFADVTKLKRAQAALKERERLLNDVIEGSPSLVYLKDMQGRFLAVNKRLEGLLGLTREQLKGKTDFDVLPKDKAEYYREHDRRVAELREPLEIEEVADFRDGRHVFLASKFPLLDAEGHVYGVGSISHDITERKRVEDALRESERRSRLLFESTSDGAWIHTLDGIIREVNNAYCELSGYTREELVGMPVGKLEAKESSEGITAYVDRVIAQGGHGRFESKHRRKDGSVVDVDITTAYLDGGDDRIAIFTREITERKRAEEQLRESEERLRSLAESVPSVLMRYDRQFRVLYLSSQSESVTGVPVAEFLGKTNREVGMPEALCSRWEEAIDQVFRTGKRREVEFDFSSKQGQRTFVLRLAPEKAADGSVQHVLGISTDITDRKRAEDAIREVQSGEREKTDEVKE